MLLQPADEVEGQLAMRIDVVVTLVKEHRDATAVVATMFDDPLGERLDCAARKAASILKEGADEAGYSYGGVTGGAGDVLAVLEHAIVVDLSDLLDEAVCCVGVVEKEAVA